MKNSNHSVFHPLTWVLGLILVSVSLETWGQNLDLTIPSLEMPSTLVLDSKDKQEIMMGWTCCWDKKHISNVQTEHSLKLIQLQLKENQNQSLFTQFNFNEPVSKTHWTIFWTLQALDVFTTYKGLKCEGVEEMNPLFGEQPSLSRILITKTILLSPIVYLEKNYIMSNKHLITVTGTQALVVANNLSVINKKCN